MGKVVESFADRWSRGPTTNKETNLPSNSVVDRRSSDTPEEVIQAQAYDRLVGHRRPNLPGRFEYVYFDVVDHPSAA